MEGRLLGVLMRNSTRLRRGQVSMAQVAALEIATSFPDQGGRTMMG